MSCVTCSRGWRGHSLYWPHDSSRFTFSVCSFWAICWNTDITECVRQRKLTYRQNTWNGVQCSDKYGKASYVKHCMCAWPAIHRKFFFWLAQMTLCVMTLCNFPPFIRPNVISGGPTNGLSNVNCGAPNIFIRWWLTSNKHSNFKTFEA